MPLPIEQYALIGDCHTAALVGSDGSIDWMCVPRFDSGACFAALLGGPEHGRWRIGPSGKITAVHRKYREGTLILETEFETPEGRARLTDFMPAAGADFVASKLNAIASNPDVFAKTVFVLIYDENDGLFDHVTPPTAPAGTPGEYITASAKAEKASASGCRASSSRPGRWAATSATTPSTTPRSSGCSRR